MASTSSICHHHTHLKRKSLLETDIIAFPSVFLADDFPAAAAMASAAGIELVLQLADSERETSRSPSSQLNKSGLQDANLLQARLVGKCATSGRHITIARVRNLARYVKCSLVTFTRDQIENICPML